MPKSDSSAPRRLPVRRCIGPFYLASLFCCLGFLPGAGGVLCGIRINLFWVTLLGGALGGVIGVPLLCGLMDTVLRALRGTATGRWWPTYCAAWRQNWKDALPAGGLSGALLGCWCWVIMTLPDMQRVPVSVWVCMAVGSCLLVGYFTYVYAQVVLVQLSLRSMLKNAGLLFLAAPLRTLGATLLQAVYWLAMLLGGWYALPVLLVTGFWLPVCGALVILFPVLDKAFGLREADRAAAQPAEGGV